MTEIKIRDMISMHVPELVSSLQGIVINLYHTKAGKHMAVIDVAGYPTYFHREAGTVTVLRTLIHCQHIGCSAVVRSRPDSAYHCPDHLDEIFAETGDAPQTPC